MCIFIIEMYYIISIVVAFALKCGPLDLILDIWNFIMQASGLRGVIKDGGILCFCCVCNGRRVSYELMLLFCILHTTSVTKYKT